MPRPQSSNDSSSSSEVMVQQRSMSSSSTSSDAVEELKTEPQRRKKKQEQSVTTPKRNQSTTSSADSSYRQRISTSAPPRRWIEDRVHGNFVIEGSTRKPCCFICYPPPIIKYCPTLLEDNPICITFGRCGFECDSVDTHNQHPDYHEAYHPCKGRSAVFTYAFIMNILGLLVTIYASFAMASQTEALLNIASFSTTNLMPTVIDPALVAAMEANKQATTYPSISLDLGLQALLIDHEELSTSTIIVPYDEFCDTIGIEQFMPIENCQQCHDTTLYVIIGMLVAIVAYVPTLIDNCLRCYQNFDMNCPKVSSSIWSLSSLAGYGLVYYYYNYKCLASFYDGPRYYDANGEIITGESGIVQIDFDWKMGIGQICLLAGFGLKCIELICNCCVATPTITRNRQEQRDYERLSKQAELDDEEET